MLIIMVHPYSIVMPLNEKRGENPCTEQLWEYYHHDNMDSYRLNEFTMLKSNQNTLLTKVW